MSEFSLLSVSRRQVWQASPPPASLLSLGYLSLLFLISFSLCVFSVNCFFALRKSQTEVFQKSSKEAPSRIRVKPPDW